MYTHKEIFIYSDIYTYIHYSFIYFLFRYLFQNHIKLNQIILFLIDLAPNVIPFGDKSIAKCDKNGNFVQYKMRGTPMTDKPFSIHLLNV